MNKTILVRILPIVIGFMCGYIIGSLLDVMWIRLTAGAVGFFAFYLLFRAWGKAITKKG